MTFVGVVVIALTGLGGYELYNGGKEIDNGRIKKAGICFLAIFCFEVLAGFIALIIRYY